MLDAIKTRLRVLSGHPWQPRSFICDFEQAIIAAVEIEFPHATVDRCYFHFNKSLWRKVSEVGLIVDYKNDDNLKNVIRKVMGTRISFFKFHCSGVQHPNNIAVSCTAGNYIHIQH